MLRCLASLVVLCAMSVTFAACDPLATGKDLTDTLFYPDETTFDAPGTRLVEGRFADIAGWQRRDEKLLALVEDSDKPHLLFYDYLNETQCDAGAVEDYELVDLGVDVPLTIAVWTNVDEDGYGDVRFVGSDCKERLPPLEGARFAPADPYGAYDADSAYEHLLHQRSGVLGSIEESGDEFIVLHDDAASFKLQSYEMVADSEGNQQYLYNAYILDSSGRLSLHRDFGTPEEQVELLREGITDFALDWSLLTTAHEPDSSSNQPHIEVASSEGDPQFVLADACLHEPLKQPFEFIVEQPCGSGTFHELHELAFKEFLQIRLPGRVSRASWVRYAASGDSHSYSALVTEAGETTGTLYGASVTLDPEVATSLDAPYIVEPDWEELAEEADCISKWCIFDGNRLVGDTVVLDPGDPAEGEVSVVVDTYGQDVRHDFGGGECDGMLLLANFDGETGDLICVAYEPPRNSRPLLSGVAAQPDELSLFSTPSLSSIYTDGGEKGFGVVVADVEDGAGNLYALEQNGDGHLTADLVPDEPLAGGVLPWSEVPLRYMAGVAYLSGDGRRTLHALMLDSGFDIEFQDDVTQVFHVVLPANGLLYLVDDEERGGLWFAKAR